MRLGELVEAVLAVGAADPRLAGSPGCVSCGDADVSLVLELGERRMDWAVENRGKDEIRFRIALHPKVAVRRRGEVGEVELCRDAATAVLTGVDGVSDTEGGPLLEAIVGGRTSRRLSLSMQGK